MEELVRVDLTAVPSFISVPEDAPEECFGFHTWEYWDFASAFLSRRLFNFQFGKNKEYFCSSEIPEWADRRVFDADSVFESLDEADIYRPLFRDNNFPWVKWEGIQF